MNQLSTQTAGPTFAEMMQVAEVLSHNELLPEHLRGKKVSGKFQEFSEVQRRAICFSIVNAANLWQCNPFMLAEQSYSVHGKLDYSGAFYAALANTRGNLDQQLSHSFEGKPGSPDFRITITGRIRGEQKTRTASMTLFEGKKRGDSKNWDQDPEQMLIYACSRRWVRRHCPQVLLGLVPETDDVVVPAATATPEEAPRIDAPLPTDYATMIDQAGSDTERLKAIAAQINADENLSAEETQTYLAMGRTAYAAASKSKQSTIEYADPTEAFQRWERTIKTECDTDQLVKYLDEIMADAKIGEREAKELHAMINEQIEATKATTAGR